MKDSLQQLVQPYVDTLFDNLPAEVKEQVSKAFAAPSWDASSPEGRAAWARRKDEMLEARRAELAQAMSIHMYWFNLQSEILNTEREIADLRSSDKPSAIQGDSVYSAIATLEAKLAALQERWDRPDDMAARAQLTAEIAALGERPAVLDLSSALQFLSESTGAVWTDAQLLSLVSDSDVGLYAAVPAWTPMYISEMKDHSLRQRPFVKPGRPVLAMLSPGHARELWVNGQTNCSTWVANDDFSLVSAEVYLEKPVSVSRADVRLTSKELLQILKKWEASRQPISPALPRPDAFFSNPSAVLPTLPPSLAVGMTHSSSEEPLGRAPRTVPDWAVKAREVARQYIERHRASNLYPSLKDVSSHVEGKLRQNGALGVNGKPVSAAYIGRNALQGEWWKANKP